MIKVHFLYFQFYIKKKSHKKSTVKKGEKKSISKHQKQIFILTTFILIIIFIAIVEFALKLGSYGGNLELFFYSQHVTKII